MRTIHIGMIGLGTVGGGVVKLLQAHHDDYLNNYGIDLVISRACAREADVVERLGIDSKIFTTDWHDVVSDPAVDIVVELIGGIHPAMDIFEESFKYGKHVVSANKALLGQHVEHLAELANAHGVQIRCEAAAAGGIPVVHVLEHDLMGNDILTIAGIMNGTTNYILSRMQHEGCSFEEVLKAAQEAGYAEADPSADVDGFDAASKIALLSSIGFRTRVVTQDVFMEGIRGITAEDIAYARELGYVIKLLAVGRKTETGIDVRVHPTMIPAEHQLASVDGAMNAVFVVGDAVGETMFYGAGAGSFPTASAVMGDIMALAGPLSRGVAPLAESKPFDRILPIRNIADLNTGYFIRLKVCNEIGVLAQVTTVLAEHNISIAHVNQTEDNDLDTASLIYVTHKAQESNVQDALDDLRKLNTVRDVVSVIRVEDINSWKSGMMSN